MTGGGWELIQQDIFKKCITIVWKSFVVENYYFGSLLQEQCNYPPTISG